MGDSLPPPLPPRPTSKAAVIRNLCLAGAGGALLMAYGHSKLDELKRVSLEKSTRGNLEAIRTALSLYRRDMKGSYPPELASLAGRYLSDIPLAKTPGRHRDSAKIHQAAGPDDAGGWLYNNVASDTNYGTVWVNCTHTDARGAAFTAY